MADHKAALERAKWLRANCEPNDPDADLADAYLELRKLAKAVYETRHLGQDRAEIKALRAAIGEE